MKIIRLFGLSFLVGYAILLLFSCGQFQENVSEGKDNLKVNNSIYTSLIKKLTGASSPILYQIKSTSVQEDNLVSYGFNSSKAGKIIYAGGCFSSSINAAKGDNYILFIVMVEGTYENCSIQVIDAEGNKSDTLHVPTFKLDFSAPELSKVRDFQVQGRNLKMEIKVNELGELSYNGNCSGNLQKIKKGISEILVSFPSDGQFSDCEIKLVDASGNTSEPLPLGTVRIDNTPPILQEINPVPEKIYTDRPSFAFKTSKSGTLNFKGKCRGNVEKAVVGINHISLLLPGPGKYKNCTMTITDYSKNKSRPLKISPFEKLGDNS